MKPPGVMPSRLGPWAALAACLAATFWISNGVAPWDGDRAGMWHHYEYMAQGFLNGHTYLSVEPSKELMALKDPYDYRANAKVRLWDASLYRGKYYLYFGPGPAVVLMIPWRLVTGHMLPQRMAVAVFAAAGVTGLALLLWGVRRRHFPGLSGFATGAVLVVAFHAAWLPVVLRRSGVWELPIVAAAACLWWALYFLWRFHDSGGRLRWSAAVGAALVVLISCRPTYLYEAGLILLLLMPSIGAAGRKPRSGKAVCLASAIAAAGAFALLLYNWNRFGSWLEFGQKYMLAGNEIAGVKFFNPSFGPLNLWTYLLAVPVSGPYFPFIHGAWPDHLPQGYVMYEAMYGALYVLPVQFAGFAGLAWAWRNRSDPAASAAAVAVAAAAGATVFAGAIFTFWPAACSRYVAELFAGWTVATAVGLMAVFGSEGARRFGRAARVLAAASACWTIACVWLASAEFRGFMRQTNPGTYAFVAHALDYPSEWWIRARGISFGPRDVAVRIPPSAPHAETVLVATGFPEQVNQVVLVRMDDTHARLILNGNEDSVLETPPLEAPAGRLYFRLSAPWLYPPPEHPFWDRVGDTFKRSEYQTLFSIDLGAGAYSTHSLHSFDASGLGPAVRGADPANPDSPFVDSIRPAVPAQ